MAAMIFLTAILFSFLRKFTALVSLVLNGSSWPWIGSSMTAYWRLQLGQCSRWQLTAALVSGLSSPSMYKGSKSLTMYQGSSFFFIELFQPLFRPVIDHACPCAVFVQNLPDLLKGQIAGQTKEHHGFIRLVQCAEFLVETDLFFAVDGGFFHGAAF